MNVLHAHLWGSPWTNDMGIFRLSPAVCKQLEESDSVHAIQTDMPDLWRFVDEFISNNGPCFFKLSNQSSETYNKLYKLYRIGPPFQVV